MAREQVKREYFDSVAAGEYIGRSERFVRQLIADRRIPVYRQGRCIYLRRSDLDAWLAQYKIPAVKP